MAKRKIQDAEVVEAPVKRGQGRPRGTDSTNGSRQLLEAGREILVTTHPDKITQAMVAAHAGVNPRLVRYHFGNMDNLLFELAKEMLKELEERMSKASNIEGDVFDKIKSRIRSLIQWYIDFPLFRHLLMDRIYNVDTVESKSLRSSFNKSSYKRIENIVRAGINEDLIRGEIDPRLVYLLLIGACEVFVTGRPISDVLFSEMEQEDLTETYVNFLAGVVIRGIRTEGAAAGERN